MQQELKHSAQVVHTLIGLLAGMYALFHKQAKPSYNELILLLMLK